MKKNLSETISTSAGIYQFTNLQNQKIYIGSSYNLRKRFLQHINRLSLKNHHSIHFQNAWNKYGDDLFDYKILEYIDNLDTLLEREQYYLDTFLFAQEYINKLSNKFIELGYNINPSAKNRFGTIQSKEAVYKSILNNPNRKDILQYNFNGEFIKEWSSSGEIQKELNISKSGILKCCKGLQDYCNDYIFIFKEDIESEKDYLDSLKNNPYIKSVWNKDKKGRYDKTNDTLIVFDRYGKYINKFKYQTDISILLKCTTANLSKAKNKKIIKNYYVFDLDFDYNKIITEIRKETEQIFSIFPTGNYIQVFDIFDNFITSFNSVAECAELLEMNENSIYYVLSGKRNQLKGYIFKYNDDIV